MLVQRVVEVCDIGLMMLAVMDLHRLRVDVRLERRDVVWQRGQRVSREFLYLSHRVCPEKCGFQTPHCATQFPPYLGSADVLSSPPTGGARGGVSVALAALSGRHYVDWPLVLLQFRAGAVHGGGGSRGQKHRNPKTAAACSALVSRRCDPDVPHRSRDPRETSRRIAARCGRLVHALGDYDSDGRAL